jgi:hypothetical protein
LEAEVVVEKTTPPMAEAEVVVVLLYIAILCGLIKATHLPYQ